jgi:hypothetical protein
MASEHADEREARATIEPEGTVAEHRPRLRLGIWGTLMTALLAMLAVGGVVTVSYETNFLRQRTDRIEDYRSFVDIWSEQVGDLPEAPVQWLLDGGFVAAIVVVVVCVAYGAWLLLISSSASPDAAMARSRRRNGT